MMRQIYGKNLWVEILNSGEIELLVKRGMSLQCNMMDRELTLLDDTNSISITQKVWIKER